MSKTKEITQDVIFKCCQALDDKKAENVRILDLRGKSSVTDFFVIATGNSDPHLKSLVKEAEDCLQSISDHKLRSQKDEDSGWMVLDAFDFMVHLFKEDAREFFGLEMLWRDAKEIEWQPESKSH